MNDKIILDLAVMAQSRGELLVTKLELGNEKLSHSPTTEGLHLAYLISV